MATATRPTLAGDYFDWEASVPAVTPPAIGGVVAVAAPADFGIINTAVLLSSPDQYSPMFGDSDTDLSRGVADAFTGQGLSGKAGASGVIVYRMASSSAAAATHTLQNTTPAAGIVLTALYPGTRADALRLTVQAGTVSGTKELLILDGALVVEEYIHEQTDLASLVAEINASSDWVSATVTTDGIALANVSGIAMTGGDDGATLSGSDWTAMETALDREQWAIFAPYGLIDGPTVSSVAAWIIDRNTNGARSFVVFGGDTDEDLTTANARSLSLNNWDILNLGRGTLLLTDVNRSVSTAEFVARYAGARAWRGEVKDDIYVRFANVELLDGPSLDEQTEALAGGTIVFSRDTNATAPVFIREGVTTYTDDSQSTVDDDGKKTHPVSLYKRIKNIAIQHGIELEVSNWATGGDVLGELPVNDKTRQLVLGRVKIAYSNRETAQIVQTGWTVDVAGVVSDDDDFVQYVHGFHPTRSLRQILNTARIG